MRPLDNRAIILWLLRGFQTIYLAFSGEDALPLSVSGLYMKRTSYAVLLVFLLFCYFCPSAAFWTDPQPLMYTSLFSPKISFSFYFGHEHGYNARHPCI